MNHPTTTKDRLMNKILSHMMITCSQKITPEQVQTLQETKDNPSDYATLLNYDINIFKVDESLPEDKQTGPVDMTKEEVRMQMIVEVLPLYLPSHLLTYILLFIGLK
jgi:hypothetical protein